MQAEDGHPSMQAGEATVYGGAPRRRAVRGARRGQAAGGGSAGTAVDGAGAGPQAEEMNDRSWQALVDFLRPRGPAADPRQLRAPARRLRAAGRACSAACPRLQVLATSREALRRRRARRPSALPSLAVPDPDRRRRSERLAEIRRGAPLRRARARRPARFALTPSNAAAVAQICRRLDGIPLAHRAGRGARARAVASEQIAARLDDRFRLLTGGSRTALPRQQTLRALIDWSYDLLDEPERRLLRRLAVFSGGWTLEAAEDVRLDRTAPATMRRSAARGPCDRPPPQLVDKSLVLVEERGGEARYRLLETLRQVRAGTAGASAGGCASATAPSRLLSRRWPRLRGRTSSVRKAAAWYRPDRGGARQPAGRDGESAADAEGGEAGSAAIGRRCWSSG